MPSRQYKITKNRGRDTHVRDVKKNIWQQQSTRTFETVIGEIFITQPEPLFRQNMVTVKLARGGTIKNVAYPGAFIEPVSGNIHGLYEGPIPGQMVSVGFANGNLDSPYVTNRYPYQGTGNSFTELQYFNPLSKAGINATDVIMGHFSGSYLSFNTGILPSTEIPGSVRLKAMTDFNCVSNTNILFDAIVSAEVKSAAAKLTGSATATVGAPDVKLSSTLGGEIDVQALIKIKNAAQSMKTLVDTLIDVVSGLSTTNCVPGAPVALSPATIALLAAEKAKWALLLSA